MAIQSSVTEIQGVYYQSAIDHCVEAAHSFVMEEMRLMRSEVEAFDARSRGDEREKALRSFCDGQAPPRLPAIGPKSSFPTAKLDPGSTAAASIGWRRRTALGSLEAAASPMPHESTMLHLEQLGPGGGRFTITRAARRGITRNHGVPCWPPWRHTKACRLPISWHITSFHPAQGPVLWGQNELSTPILHLLVIL